MAKPKKKKPKEKPETERGTRPSSKSYTIRAGRADEPTYRIPTEFDDTTDVRPTSFLKKRIAEGKCGVRLVNKNGRPYVAVYRGSPEPKMFAVSGPDEAERIAERECAASASLGEMTFNPMLGLGVGLAMGLGIFLLRRRTA